MASESRILENKVCIVTGGSSGIGREIAILFARHGALLSLAALPNTGLEETRDLCIKEGLTSEQILLVPCDLAAENECEKIITDTHARFDRIDVLINCAGIATRDSIETVGTPTPTPSLVSCSPNPTKFAKFDQIMAVNLRAPMAILHFATPHLIKTKGTVVNLASIYALRGIPEAITYSVSKGALSQLTKSAAMALASKGVRVNSVAPAHIRTDIPTQAGVPKDKLDDFYNGAAKIYPVGRVGEPQEVAEAVLYLASSRSSFTTGTCLKIDGGLMAAWGPISK